MLTKYENSNGQIHTVAVSYDGTEYITYNQTTFATGPEYKSPFTYAQNYILAIIWGDADEKNVDIHVHPYHSLDASTV